MRCPKCDSAMERVMHESIEIDRCTLCKGIWFDAMEKEDLVALEGSGSIDVGTAARGRRYDKMREAQCPRCSVTMTPMVDTEQTHIHFEACPSCSGTFFDAGEFRDLKEFTVLERLVAKLRALRG